VNSNKDRIAGVGEAAFLTNKPIISHPPHCTNDSTVTKSKVVTERQKRRKEQAFPLLQPKIA
jgi:hypothetical protein